MQRVFDKVDSLVNKLATNYTLLIVVGAIVLGIIGLKVFSTIFPPLLEPPVYGSYRVLQTEWSDARRERYYQTSQGTLAVPYAWYRALEFRTGRELFASPNVQVRYGLLPDNDPTYNPEQLPVGIVKTIVPDEYVETLGEGQKEWAGLSCAACHTGQLLYKGTALRIDGGQGSWRFEQWSQDLVASLIVTSASPSKFERFCARVYGQVGRTEKCSNDQKKTLYAQLKRYFDSDLVRAAINAVINHTYPNKEGFMRTDALGRGVNGVFGPLDRRNVRPGSGAVSYPPLWYTHYFDWVQSPAAIRQPLARNVTEAWGVNVRVEVNDQAKLFGSTASIDDMFWMETLLSTLQAPRWPETVLGPIDRERVERGRHLFNDAVWDKARPAEQAELPPDSEGRIRGPNPNRPTTGYCARCHAPAWETAPNIYGKRYLQLPLYRMEVMGTDPNDAIGFNQRVVHTGVLKKEYGDQEAVGIGEALEVSVGGVLKRWFDEHNVPEPCRVVMEGSRKNLFRAPKAYPARPLDGYWATGPFLHNGSVRTLYQLLSPAEERSRSFWIGSFEFDPVDVGFRDERVPGGFLFDTTLAGNSNAGHEFRDAPANTPGVIGPLLTTDQRRDIIEYLKVLVSDEIEKNTKTQLAWLDAMAPYYEQYAGSVPYGTPEKEGGWKRTELCKAIVGATTTGSSDLPKKK
jgi:RoxA-like, cytochrome c-like